MLRNNKRRKNEELFIDGKKTLRFVADNGFGKAVCSYGKDISVIFNELASGSLNVQDVENIMVCGLVDIDDEKVVESEKEQIAQNIIDDYGLQECHQLCFLLLSHLMLGEKKSSKIEIQARAKVMIDAISGPSMNLKKAGLLWVAKLMVSTALVCMISSYYVINFMLKTA